MTLFLLTFGISLLAVFGMALGAILRNRPIRAGCGGFPEGEDGDAACPVCDGSCATDGAPDNGPRSSPR